MESLQHWKISIVAATIFFSIIVCHAIPIVNAFTFRDAGFNDAGWQSVAWNDGPAMEVSAAEYPVYVNGTGHRTMKLQLDNEYLYAHWPKFEGLRYGAVSVYDYSNPTVSIPIVQDLTDPRWTAHTGLADFTVNNSRIVACYHETGVPNPQLFQISFFEKDGSGEIISTANLRVPVDNCPLTCAMNNDWVYVILESRKLCVIDGTDFTNPTFYQNVTIVGDNSLLDGNDRYMQVDDNLCVFFDGHLQLLVFDVSTPGNPVQILPNMNFTHGVNDISLHSDRLYVAGKSSGLFVYNISNPFSDLPHLPSILPGSYAPVGCNITAVVPYNETAVYVGDANGTVALINISDEGVIKVLKEFIVKPCTALALDKSTKTLAVGTDGLGDFLYIINVPEQPILLNDNLADNTFETNTFMITPYIRNIANNGPYMEFSFEFPAIDGDGKPRSIRGICQWNRLFLYNDTDGDGRFTPDLIFEEGSTNIIKTIGSNDEIFAVPIDSGSSYAYTAPEIVKRNGILTINFNFTCYGYTLNALSTNPQYKTIPVDYPSCTWTPDVDKNVTFDLTYSVWIYKSTSTNFTVKVDTSLTNWDFSQFTGGLPSAIRIFAGSKTYFSVACGYSTNDYEMVELCRVPTEIVGESCEQKFRWNGGLFGLIEQAASFRKVNASGIKELACIRSAMAEYSDEQNQKHVADIGTLYQWVVGANFPIDATTTAIYYDPEATFITWVTENEDNDNEEDGEGIWIIIVATAIPIAIITVFLVIRQRKRKRNTISANKS